MNPRQAACLATALLLTGCSHSAIAPFGAGQQSEFEKKVICISSAERTMKVRGSWHIDEKTYIDQSLFSPKRNSCVAVLVFTTGDFASSYPGSRDTFSDTYDIIDTLTYERIGHQVSGIGTDRTKTMEDIDRLVSDLKKAK